MRNIGFSTGALAKGNFLRGMKLQETRSKSLELSALREAELDPLIGAIPDLDVNRYQYVSLHAPSKLVQLSETQLVERLMTVANSVHAIIVHPDLIQDSSPWLRLGDKLVLENMDQRKKCGRTADELQMHFDALPNARFCFDIGHARQVDPTLGVARELLRRFGNRLAEIHISEVDAHGAHVAISHSVMTSFRRISSLLPADVPAIIESIIEPTAIADEMTMARASLGDQSLEQAACN